MTGDYEVANLIAAWKEGTIDEEGLDLLWESGYFTDTGQEP